MSKESRDHLHLEQVFDNRLGHGADRARHAPLLQCIEHQKAPHEFDVDHVATRLVTRRLTGRTARAGRAAAADRIGGADQAVRVRIETGRVLERQRELSMKIWMRI